MKNSRVSLILALAVLLAACLPNRGSACARLQQTGVQEQGSSPPRLEPPVPQVRQKRVDRPRQRTPNLPASELQKPQPDSTPGNGIQATGNLPVANPPVILKTEAYAGRPFGIGRISYRLREGDQLIDRTGAILLEDADKRVLYPVVTQTAFRTFIQTLTGDRNGEPENVHHVWFLFKGEEPLNLILRGSGDASVVVPVEYSRNRQYERFVGQWWQAFTRSVDEQIEAGDYPPIVETYLTTMVGKRLGFQPVNRFEGRRDPLSQTFELLFNVESIRLETIQNTMFGGIDQTPANLPVPPSIQWTPLVVTGLPEQIEIEPIAQCVPNECFYLRFGTWQNQIWLQRLLEEYGGNLGRMVSLRGFQYRLQSKFLNQLAIQSSEWDQLFGGNLIDDVAVIGTDTYFDDGSAVGVVLHAINSERLKTNLLSKRNKFVAANSEIGVTLEAVQLGTYTVELLSTPDNRYRSFYAVSGDCHLMTTSRRIAQRFMEAGDGIGSLGQSDEYHFARYNMPLNRDDTVFVYMSSRFFQELLTPQYQIELRRRNQVITDMMLLELGTLAGANEGASTDVPELIRNGFLPNGFGTRPDKGFFRSDGQHWVDSIRGRRGFFVPIPDLELGGVTAEEAEWYGQRANFFARSIQSLDPMFVALKRYELKKNVERIVFDGRIAPFGEDKYGWLMSMLGPPLKHEIAATPTDLIRLQASMQGGLENPNVPPHQIFAAVQNDLDVHMQLTPTSFLRTMDIVREAPAYVGAWPSPGYTNWLPALGGKPDPLGYTYSRLLNLWRLQWEGFSVLSFDQDRLEKLKPHLKVVESERAAQVRLVVGDLENSMLDEWANGLNYRRSWQTSIANVRFLNLLTQQFRVPPEMARATAERMLDVELVCSLDGQYQLSRLPSGRSIWSSSAWPSFSRPLVPQDHQAPLMKWFRGLEAEVSKGETQFSIHGFLDVERDQQEAGLPSFELFGGFGNLLGMSSGSKPKRENGENQLPENVAPANPAGPGKDR